jgi:hypothetical protein
MADARSDVCRTWTNDAMVNTLHVAHDGLTITTGDSKVGSIQLRIVGCVRLY